MRLADAIIFSLCVGIFIIGVYETMTVGIAYSYWLFMLSVGLLLWYNHRRRTQNGEEEEKPKSKSGAGKKKKSSKK
ncbi:MAG: hypothetical protein ACFB15_24085 [Cyclobacteriaceae bacterium]